ncbi:MAG: NTP transferase domain-containing protein, partial [Pseudomonadota bacterium]
MEDSLAAIVLAAGFGTRMRSARAKVLHELGGEPMIARTLRAIGTLDPRPLVVVVGHQAEEVKAAARRAVSEATLAFAIQSEQHGTGDAARCALGAIPASFAGEVLIGYGDMPALNPATLRGFIANHRAHAAKLSFISVKIADPAAYGRVIRDEMGAVSAIVEARDASPAELAINEINTGVYLASVSFLRTALGNLRSDNAQHEHYLTDIVAIARRHGLAVNAWLAGGAAEFAGINSREELARMEAQI